MRLSLALIAISLTACGLGLGPLPAEVDELSDHLRQWNFQLVPAEAAYDRAFERIVPDVHVVSYEVTAKAPTVRGRRQVAFMDIFQFASDEEVERGLAGMRTIPQQGRIYTDGRLMITVRGAVVNLDEVLTRRFGNPV